MGSARKILLVKIYPLEAQQKCIVMTGMVCYLNIWGITPGFRSPAKEGLIGDAFKLKTVRRREFLVQEGDVCKHIWFVICGAWYLKKENNEWKIVEDQLLVMFD